MPAPLAPRKRAAILADIEAGGKSARQIGKAHGVSDAAVRRIAKAEGLVDAWSRDKTVKATHARVADNKAKRAQLQSDLLDDAQKLRARAWSRYPVVVSGMEGAEKVWLDLPPLPDVRAAYTSIGIIVDKDRAYEKDAADGGSEHAKSMLGKLFEGLAAAVGEPETPPDDG
jgi:hypothetical protein